MEPGLHKNQYVGGEFSGPNTKVTITFIMKSNTEAEG
jgi:hypothetical protein